MWAARLTESLGLRKLPPGFLMQSLSVQHFRQFAVHLGCIWVETHRLAQMLGGMNQIPAVGQDHRQVIVGLERGWIRAQCVRVGGDGVIRASQFKEQIAEIDLAACIAWIEPRCGGVV